MAVLGQLWTAAFEVMQFLKVCENQQVNINVTCCYWINFNKNNAFYHSYLVRQGKHENAL